MGICLDRNARYRSTPGGFPTAETFVWQAWHPSSSPASNNLKTKKISTFCRGRDIFTWLCNQVSRHTPIVSSHHILSGFPIYPKIAPYKFPPFPIDPKIGPSDRQMFGGRVFTLQDLVSAHFGLNSGANVLSVCCWLSPFLSLYWQQRL